MKYYYLKVSSRTVNSNLKQSLRNLIFNTINKLHYPARITNCCWSTWNAMSMTFLGKLTDQTNTK